MARRIKHPVLRQFRGGQFQLYRAWDLVKFRGGPEKKNTLYMTTVPGALHPYRATVLCRTGNEWWQDPCPDQ